MELEIEYGAGVVKNSVELEKVGRYKAREGRKCVELEKV